MPNRDNRLNTTWWALRMHLRDPQFLALECSARVGHRFCPDLLQTEGCGHSTPGTTSDGDRQNRLAGVTFDFGAPKPRLSAVSPITAEQLVSNRPVLRLSVSPKRLAR
jgi:hypothetical protein